MPQLDESSDGEDTQSQRQQTHGRLSGDQEFSPIEMIGRKASHGQQQQLRTELERHHDTDRGRVPVGELGEHDPVLGGALHPRANI
ncbi:hypothetical protein HDE77_001091 [Rhodanobacter sp. MP7CTX1]|nr:hypothetical protein [Rhodanobacter sp. MP7CTX1]